jgi:hypothetical protein
MWFPNAFLGVFLVSGAIGAQLTKVNYPNNATSKVDM